MSNGLPKYCVRICIDILVDDVDRVAGVAEALQAIGQQIATDLRSPVLVSGDVLTNTNHDDSSGAASPPRKEANPLN